MKNFTSFLMRSALVAGFVGVTAVCSAADAKAPTNKPAASSAPEKKAVISTGFGNIQSVFTAPTSLKDGRDPFFPESGRAMENAMAQSHTVEISSLKVPGISGTRGHLFAIINNHTFAIGEEGDVKTAGGPVHLRCVDIQNSAVLVEINGQIHRIAVAQ
jgi:hypothetical protein